MMGIPLPFLGVFWSTQHQFQEGKLKEAAVRYEPDFAVVLEHNYRQESDAFVSEVLKWL
jgi:hypothetical protein